MNPFIVADAESCIGCRSCEVACVVAHYEGKFPDKPDYFTPRVKVFKGNQSATAVFCHHCEDAPCASTCPNGAIVELNNSVQVIQEKWYRLQTCMIACPFGMMTVVTETVATRKSSPGWCLSTYWSTEMRPLYWPAWWPCLHQNVSDAGTDTGRSTLSAPAAAAKTPAHGIKRAQWSFVQQCDLAGAAHFIQSIEQKYSWCGTVNFAAEVLN